jgi:predicted nuclease with TOPRIM domain
MGLRPEVFGGDGYLEEQKKYCEENGINRDWDDEMHPRVHYPLQEVFEGGEKVQSLVKENEDLKQKLESMTKELASVRFAVNDIKRYYEAEKDETDKLRRKVAELEKEVRSAARVRFE